jgi:hypothetical protein
VREWYLGGAARCYRQTIMLSSFAAADMNSAVQRFCSSHAGRLRLKQEQEGVLSMVVPQVRPAPGQLLPAAAAGWAQGFIGAGVQGCRGAGLQVACPRSCCRVA